MKFEYSKGQQGYVERNDDYVDDEQLPHRPSNALLRDDLRNAEKLLDVETRDDESLQAKAVHLNLLDDKDGPVKVDMVRIGPVVNDHG